MISPSPHPGPDHQENSLDLGPDLPMPMFISTDPWHPERIGALALYCSDGRWGEAFDEFCHQCLQIPRYDRWAVPGGPAWLADLGAQQEFASAARDQLDFLVQVHELERIVLITHYGCAAYEQRLQRSAQACLGVQIKDLLTAADALRNRHSGLRVEGYLAMRRGRSLSFYNLLLHSG